MLLDGTVSDPDADSVRPQRPGRHRVAVAGRIRLARYEQAENLTLQQAQRDLRDLVTAGPLAPVGRTRARYYIDGPRFPTPVLALARTPFTLVSPYPND